MNRFLLLVLAAALATGCTMIPKYQRPPAPVSDAWPDAPNPPATNAIAADIGWREFFDDARLQRLIELALENNRDLRVALLNIENSRAALQAAQLALLPQISASGVETRERLPVGFSDTGQAMTIGQYSAAFGFTGYEVDLFGRIRSLKAQALEQYLSSEEARRAAHLSLVSEVAVQYLTVCEMDDQLAVARQTLDSTRNYLGLIRQMFDIGTATELDLSSAQSQVQSSRASVAQYLRLRAQAENALVLLVGCPLPADLPAALPLEVQQPLADLPAGLPSDLLQRRPDILAAEHQLKAANANIGAARAAFFPRLLLTGNGGSTSLQLSGLFGPGTLAWTFMPEITLPIFDAGVNEANLDVARTTKRIEIAQYEKAIQTAFREVADALAARANLEEELAADTALVDAEQKRYDIAGARYRNGVDNYLTVLTAQQDLNRAQQSLVQARFLRLANLVSLYQALGGGWNEFTPPPQTAGR
jgi:multidrug efflux system outer membrane protein